MKLSRTFGAAAFAALAFGSMPSNAADLGFELRVIDSTTLTSSLTGVSILNTAANKWLVDFAGSPIFVFAASDYSLSWKDNDPGEVNWLRAIGGTQFELRSDVPIADYVGYAGCGSAPVPLDQGVTCIFGVSATDAYFVTVTEAAPVPVPASLALFGAAIGGLAVATRKRKAEAA